MTALYMVVCNGLLTKVSGEIRLLNKEIISIPIDPQKVKALWEEVQALKEDYNRKVEMGVLHSELA